MFTPRLKKCKVNQPAGNMSCFFQAKRKATMLGGGGGGGTLGQGPQC